MTTDKTTITENANMSNGSLTAITLQLLKESNPKVGVILMELKTTRKEIRDLHDLKKAHRKAHHTWIERTSFFYLGKKQCDRCESWNTKQELLRDKKSALYAELERLSYGMDPLELLAIEEMSGD